MARYIIYDSEEETRTPISASSKEDAIRKYVKKHMGPEAGVLDIESAVETFSGEVYEEDTKPEVPTGFDDSQVL